MLNTPIGETSIMHTHNTFPSMAQQYHIPMWKVPSLLEKGEIKQKHFNTILGSKTKYEETFNKYKIFCHDLLERTKHL